MDRAIALPVPRRRRGVLARLLAGLALARSRRRLLDLDARLLDDVGLTPAEARREAADAAHWNAPDHWLR